MSFQGVKGNTTHSLFGRSWLQTEKMATIISWASNQLWCKPMGDITPHYILLHIQPSLTAVCEIVTKFNLYVRVHGLKFSIFFVSQHDFQTNVFQLEVCFMLAPSFYFLPVGTLEHRSCIVFSCLLFIY